MSYSYETRRAVPAPAVRRFSHLPPQRGNGNIPNSAYPGVLDGGMDGETLENAMRSKMQSMFSSAYIDPRAEAEADRIGNRFSDASGVEDLKARMGSALGADFSGIRFHTGADAASMAPTAEDSFSSGKDIYMGGGFNPTIAAHEMVHTLQTGAVHSAASVTSVPSGAVQGWNFVGKRNNRPNSLWGKFKNWVSRKWNHSGMVKAHRKAVDHYNNNKDDYKDMSRWERFKWTFMNPLARMRGGSKTSMAETEKRNQIRDEEADAAKNLSSLWTDDALGDARGKLKADPAAEEDDGMPKEDSMMQDFAAGNIGGGIHQGINDVADTVDFINLPLAFVPGLGAAASFVDAGTSFARAGSATGSAIGNGATQSMLNSRVKAQAKNTKDLEEKKKSSTLTEEERYQLTKNRALQQGSTAAGIRKSEGANNAVSSSIQGTGSTLGGMAYGLDAVAPGLGTAIGGTIQLMGVGAGLLSNKIGQKVINKQKKAFRKNTVNQELNIEEKIDALRGKDESYYSKLGLSKEQAENLTKSEAKHLILKSMGFKSGKYKEAFNQITKNRAQALTDRANEGGKEEIGIMKDMFLNRVNKDGKKQYSAAGVAQKLGYQVLDPKYFEGNNIFKKRADENRAERAKAKEKKLNA